MQRQVGIFLHGVGILEGIEHALDKVLADAAIPVFLGGGVIIIGIFIVLGGQGEHILKQLIARRKDTDRLPAFHGIAESVLLAIAYHRDGSAAGILRGIEGVIQLRTVHGDGGVLPFVCQRNLHAQHIFAACLHAQLAARIVALPSLWGDKRDVRGGNDGMIGKFLLGLHAHRQGKQQSKQNNQRAFQGRVPRFRQITPSCYPKCRAK